MNYQNLGRFFKVPKHYLFICKSLALLSFIVPLPVFLNLQGTAETIGGPFSFWVAMQFNTALGISGLGLALYLICLGYLQWANAVGLTIFALGSATLVQYLFGIDLKIDGLFREAHSSVLNHPGRMAQNTAISLIASSLALILLTRHSSRGRSIIAAGLLSSVPVSLGAIKMIGHLYDLTGSLDPGSFAHMSLPTAFGVIASGVVLMGLSFQQLSASKDESYRLASYGVMIVLLFVTLSLWQVLINQNKIQSQHLFEVKLENVKNQIKERLNETSLAIKRFASRVEYVGSNDKGYLILDAKGYIEQISILKRIALVDSKNKIFWSYPTELGYQVENFNQMAVPVRKEAFDEARETREPSLSRSVELLSGGFGFIMPVAIFRKNRHAGYLYATVEASKLFSTLSAASDFEITVLDSGKQIFPALKRYPPSEQNIKKTLKWGRAEIEIIGSPTAQLLSFTQSRLPSIVLFGGVIITILFGSFLQSTALARKNEIQQESERSYALEWQKAILKATPHTVISTDEKGIIQTFNVAAEKMLKYKAEELIGKSSPAIIHDTSEVVKRAGVLSKELGWKIEPGFEVFVVKARTTNLPDENEWTYIAKDGTRIPISLSVTVLYDTNKNITGYLGVGVDLTERNEARRQLEVALRKAEAATTAKSVFLANMSHEIRTPINFIVGMTGFLLDSNLNSEQREHIKNLKINSDALLALINDILDFSKIEAGKLELEEVEFDFSEIVERTLKTAQFLAQKKSLSIEGTGLNDIKYHLWGDPGRLRQVLTNLVANAVKFSSSGKIRVHIKELASSNENMIKLRCKVEDNGIGISQEKIPTLFQSFTQADISTTRKFGGTGLGLSICRQLIELMGGKIGAHSTMGKGSTFWFEVELKKGSPLSEKKKLNTPLVYDQSVWKNVRILVAEDNTFNQIVILKQLEKFGIRADTAANGEEAIAALKALPYDLVLMDCNMPQMDGLEATRRIRKNDKVSHFSTVPIIAVTANASQESKSECLDAGMSDFLTKPVYEVDLYKTLSLWLKSSANNTVIAPKETLSLEAENALAKLAKLQVPGEPDLIVELIDVFIQQSASTLKEIEESLANHNFEILAKKFHTLKSTSRTLGSNELGFICETLERYAKAEKVQSIQNRFNEFKLSLNETTQFLKTVKQTRMKGAA